MKAQSLFLFLLLLTVVSCSGDDETDEHSAIIEGQITVDPALDETRDYSGIELISTIRSSVNESDTLFHAITDSTGSFSGIASFSERNIYPLLITRNNNTFGIVNVVFAENDTIRITGQLPNINETVDVSSRENEVIEVFQRIERNFSRVARFINAGIMSPDSAALEVNKWSDIYWDIYEKYPDTYGAKLAGETSISMLSGLNDSLMVNRSEELLQNYHTLMPVTRETLLEYYAETSGLERALAFIEDLKSRTDQEDDLIDLEMERIELLYDSSQTVQANQVLDQFKETYAEHEMVMQWAEDISYDLEFLAPGSPFPNLNFQLVNGDSLRIQELQGNPFLIEITRFENPLYQQQFNRTVAIHQIYKNFGLDIVTVPLATTDVTMNAFFEERQRLWKVVQPNSFNADQLIERLNLNRVPTRFLVNSDGTIIRRYVAEEYDDIVRGLQQITTQTEE
ncbi:TlpA family protein disulfide reductase [Rhodohalobacter sp. 614A]|uniref:TlpA family protein disulfide reductase n=1 Tax=Rhodohalobacter sp. 614A TaxID=2908649 RepID=UPI001F341CC5|nr:thioredoxin family protein [Rhodohalobacter sp. 614A]